MISTRVFLLSILALQCSNALAQQSHDWTAISYPSVSTCFADGVAIPSIRNTEEGMQLTLAFGWSIEDAKKENFKRPDGSKITSRLHFVDGRKIEPAKTTLEDEMMAFVRREHSSGSHSCTFPWDENEMHEAWLELVMPEHTYWLEIPYGFTRDPAAGELPSAKTGSPKLPPSLLPFPANTQIVNWKHVNYDIGEIQNGWRLALHHSNPFDARSEIILYRQDTEIGKSMFLWDLHTPRTKLSIEHANDFLLTSRAMSLRLHDDGMRRSDSFEYNRNPGNGNLRNWGTMIIEVDNKKWSTIMPSSLFRYVHGVSDPYHKSTIR